MTKNYFIKNIPWGIICFVAISYIFHDDWKKSSYVIIVVYSAASCLLYPSSKFFIEKLALKFTSRKFWESGYFSEDIGKYGLYAIYFLFCFIFAIPFNVFYLFMKK
ncbi:colicin E1 family microcin immunity protein [Erwinia papayae]|uniref:Colicin E1 family microcin immunity protein n=1 Tax=Erwinia papayae TaxID=206499 RepID=A0ABV3N5N1_9GAMM